MKDWTGNNRSIFRQIGASNHSEKERQSEDFYATDPKAAELLLEVEQFSPKIWECACGQGHLSKVFEKRGFQVRSTDLVNRGYGEQKDFLFFNDEEWEGDIITNPPYKFAMEFIYKALEIIRGGYKVAMFLKIQFLEGKLRRKLYDKYPPKTIYVFSSRIPCAINGDFEKMNYNSAVAYAWFVWEKGYKGDTIIKWIN